MNLDEYTQALQKHDWYFEYSDDHNVWKKGNEAAKKLRAAQTQLDPLGTIWNQHAPRDCQIKPR